MNTFPLSRSPENASPIPEDIILDESLPLPQMCLNSSPEPTTSLNPSPALPPSFKEDEAEARELAKVIRRIHAADKRYWEESEFLLLRNEVALQTLFQDNNRKLDYFEIEEDAEEMEFPKAENSPFQERETDEEEEERRVAIVDGGVDHNSPVEKYRGAIHGLRDDQTTPQSLDVQLIDDRMDKARSDLSILEQQTRQIETEMKTLQAELAKLKDQLHQTQIQFDDIQEQQLCLTESFNSKTPEFN